MNYEFTMNDYEWDMSNDADKLLITRPTAARIFGGDDGYQTCGRESTDRTRIFFPLQK